MSEHSFDQLATFKEAAVGSTVAVSRREFDWVFLFSSGATISVASFWRICNAQQIIVTRDDDGHKYGLPAAVDAELTANETLKNCAIQSIFVDRVTSDLTIEFANDLKFQTITHSSGYEPWQADADGVTIIGLNGDLAIFENK